METKYNTLSDAELLAKFRSCSPKTGERLVMYAELKKRNMLNLIAGDSQLLFKGTAPMGGSASIWVAIGVLIIGFILTQFERTTNIVFVMWLLLFVPFLNFLNLFIYRSIFIFPDRITVATCVCLDMLKLKSKTIGFSEQGLYLNVYSAKGLLPPPFFPHEAFLYLRSIPDVTPLLNSSLRLKTMNKLLGQLNVFFKSIEQNVIIESNSPKIPTARLTYMADFKSFCLRQSKLIHKADPAMADINWLRLISAVATRPIPAVIQNDPLLKRPDWLGPEEYLVLCLNTWIGFRKKAYLFFTSCRLVWATLAGDYIIGSVYNDIVSRPYYPNKEAGVWLIKFEENEDIKGPDSHYPFSSIFTYFTNRRECK